MCNAHGSEFIQSVLLSRTYIPSGLMIESAPDSGFGVPSTQWLLMSVVNFYDGHPWPRQTEGIKIGGVKASPNPSLTVNNHDQSIPLFYRFDWRCAGEKSRLGSVSLHPLCNRPECAAQGVRHWYANASSLLDQIKRQGFL